MLRSFILTHRNLVDIKKSGKLNAEQFALAMWLIARKVCGCTCLFPQTTPPSQHIVSHCQVRDIEIPAALEPEMVPPSFRSAAPNAPGEFVCLVLVLNIRLRMHACLLPHDKLCGMAS